MSHDQELEAIAAVNYPTQLQSTMLQRHCQHPYHPSCTPLIKAVITLMVVSCLLCWAVLRSNERLGSSTGGEHAETSSDGSLMHAHDPNDMWTTTMNPPPPSQTMNVPGSTTSSPPQERITPNAPPTTRFEAADTRRHAVTKLHVQGVLLGDSMLAYTNYTTSKFRFKVDDFLSDILQKSLRGAMMRRTVGSQIPNKQRRPCSSGWTFSSDAVQSVTSYWSDILNDSDRVLDETMWMSVVKRSRTLLHAAAAPFATTTSHHQQQRSSDTELALIRSASASTFTMPGASTHQFAEAAQQCLTGTLNLTTFLYHASCFAFLTSLESGLKAAARNGAEEVIFLIFTAVGINNMNLDPLSWVPATEVERVMSVMRTAVRVLVGDVGNKSGNKEHRTQGGASVRLLLEQSFRGKRHATVVASSVPGVLFFNNATVPLPSMPSTAPSMKAFTSFWNLNFSEGFSSATQRDTLETTFPVYKPVKPFCRTMPFKVEVMSCHFVCAQLTASYDQRRIGLTNVMQYEHELQSALTKWWTSSSTATAAAITSDEVVDRVSLKLDIVPELVPMRQATLGRCMFNNKNRIDNALADGGHDEILDVHRCFAEHPLTLRNTRDCVHVSSIGARRVALVLIDTWVRRLTCPSTMER